jgi:outer membrane lipoprotein SlyB
MMHAVATDYEALNPVTFLPQASGHNCCLTAEFSSLIDARAACRALRDAGIEATHVALLGQLGDEVSTATGLSADERLMLGSFARHVVVDSALGALVGAVLNLLAAQLLIGSGAGLSASAVAGAVFGAIVGGLVGGVGSVGRSSTKREVHRQHPELEHTIVGIETEDPAEIERAETILRQLQPVQIMHQANAEAAP